jgi:hypothetical protein
MRVYGTRETFDIVTHVRTGEKFLRWLKESLDGDSFLYSRLSPRCRDRGGALQRASRRPHNRVWFRLWNNAHEDYQP